MPTISLQHAELRHAGKLILKNIDISIPTGQSVAILGESGAGKSSLLNLLRSAAADNSAWCPQQKGLVPSLSAFHNIYAGTLEEHHFFTNLLNFFWPQKNALKYIQQVTDTLDITPLLEQKTAQLSGGQQQRVAIARAVIQQKSIFIGDEPLSAVDEFMAAKILQQVNAQRQSTVVALHDVSLALQYCDRSIGIKDGEIALDASSAELNRADLYFLYPHERI